MNDVPANLLRYESALYAAGYRSIAGVDEVGRGALAGPIVAAAVVLPPDICPDAPPWNGIRDSKVLTASKREKLATHIHAQARHCAVAEIDAATIDEIGIGPANRLVMECAVNALPEDAPPGFLLLDALTIDHACPQLGIIDGDALSLSIAAASIVAKVHRDGLMTALSCAWPAYQWERNKGYGVARHLDALRATGPCCHHRHSFRPVREADLVHHD